MERTIQVRKGIAVVLTFLAGTVIIVPAMIGQKIAARRAIRSSLSASITASNLSVSVVNLASSAPLIGASVAAMMDLGNVSYGGSRTPGVAIEQRRNSFVVDTVFGLQITDSSHQTHYATVMAYLSSPTPVIYRVNGKTLGTIPIVVASQTVVNGVSRHRLQVEVPSSVTERNAQQQAAVQFEVMPN